MNSKTNHPRTTTREDRKPKAEAVREAKEVKGAAVKAARKQNTSADDSSLFVIPKTGKK